MSTDKYNDDFWVETDPKRIYSYGYNDGFQQCQTEISSLQKNLVEAAEWNGLCRDKKNELAKKYAKAVAALKRIDEERLSVFLNKEDMSKSKLTIAHDILTELGEK
jgi:hypothetical protein